MQENRVNIGRGNSNDVVIKDEFVSGLHAQLLIRADGSYYLQDAGSSNGTFIMRNGRFQQVYGPEPVRLEDEVSLGNCRMSVSHLLSMAPPHLVTPPSFNQQRPHIEARTRPMIRPQQELQNNVIYPSGHQEAMPVQPEHAAAVAMGFGRQQGAPRVAVGSPVPGEERVIWSGYSSLSYWVLHMLWSGLWVIFWMVTAIIFFLPLLGLSFIAALGLIKKILLYINIHYEFTSQRIRRRQGVLTVRRNQVELFRVKDFEVVETMFGRIFNYCHIRLISSERIWGDAIMVAVPNGVELVEKMRRLVQINRAESGIMFLRE